MFFYRGPRFIAGAFFLLYWLHEKSYAYYFVRGGRGFLFRADDYCPGPGDRSDGEGSECRFPAIVYQDDGGFWDEEHGEFRNGQEEGDRRCEGMGVVEVFAMGGVEWRQADGYYRYFHL